MGFSLVGNWVPNYEEFVSVYEIRSTNATKYQMKRNVYYVVRMCDAITVQIMMMTKKNILRRRV